MNLWLLIPAKSFTQGKSRLAGVLHGVERAALSRQLLSHVIDTAQRAGVCTQIAVTSRDNDVLAHATALGTRIIREEPAAAPGPQPFAHSTAHAQPTAGAHLLESSLNRALDGARRVAVTHGADAVLVLPADLPCIQPADIIDLHAAAVDGAQMIIAPSRDGGTNALLLRPPTILQFAFGRQSFQRHCQQAGAAHVPYHVVHSERLAFDLDHPQDLARWQGQEVSALYADGACAACP